MRQAFIWCTAFSSAASALAALRVSRLPSWREYQLFCWMLVAWSCVGVLTITVPLSSRFYVTIFLIIVPISWILYFLIAKSLYRRVFTKYPGIAFAGRSALWMAAVSAPAVVAVSMYLSPGGWSSDWVIRAEYLLDQSALFGVTFFLLFLMSVMTRYPIPIGKNVAIHCFFFGAVLFSQTLSQIVDHWSSSHFTELCNTIAAGADAIMLTAWALLLTDAGDQATIRMRPHIKPESEIHLLSQLDALNGILLRAAGK